jgi:16S rRNA (cytidine1402-2'-O)-methyltransferase
MPAVLYVVATPIGNLSDITHRAVQTLKSVDIVACEDTRQTGKLMGHLGLSKPLMRYDEHTHVLGARRIIEHLQGGQSVALVTDAGTPAVSDPGARLVEEVVGAGFSVVPIPGPSAVAAALSASGFSGDGYVFLGFLPRRPGRARRVLRDTLGLGRTVLLFESPFRASDTLEIIAALAPAARVIVARELTKIHEEFLRGDPRAVLEQLKKRPQKGEVVILIGPEAQVSQEPEAEAG